MQIWKLQMTTKRKIAVTGVILLGASWVFFQNEKIIKYSLQTGPSAPLLLDLFFSFKPSTQWQRTSLWISTVSIRSLHTAAFQSLILTTAPVSLTVSLYWSLLEAGLALIAACLPTLSHFFTRFDFQSAIQSVRNALPLRSRHSSPNPDVIRYQMHPYMGIKPRIAKNSHAESFDNSSLTEECVIQRIDNPYYRTMENKTVSTFAVWIYLRQIYYCGLYLPPPFTPGRLPQRSRPPFGKKNNSEAIINCWTLDLFRLDYLELSNNDFGNHLQFDVIK